MTQEQSSSSFEDLELGIVNVQYTLKKIQADTHYLKEKLETRKTDESFLLDLSAYKTIVEDVIKSVIHTKVEKKLIGFETNLNYIMNKEAAPSVSKIKRAIPWLGGLFVGSLIGATLFYYTQHFFSHLSKDQTTYDYGMILRKAWPHLSDKERKRMVQLGHVTSLKK